MGMKSLGGRMKMIIKREKYAFLYTNQKEKGGFNIVIQMLL